MTMTVSPQPGLPTGGKLVGVLITFSIVPIAIAVLAGAQGLTVTILLIFHLRDQKPINRSLSETAKEDVRGSLK